MLKDNEAILWIKPNLTGHSGHGLAQCGLNTFLPSLERPLSLTIKFLFYFPDSINLYGDFSRPYTRYIPKAADLLIAETFLSAAGSTSLNSRPA